MSHNGARTFELQRCVENPKDCLNILIGGDDLWFGALCGACELIHSFWKTAFDGSCSSEDWPSGQLGVYALGCEGAIVQGEILRKNWRA
mmetsp:Transcript_54913/g.157922  ORF Transcript_54913/g.157922 Transcript_54913/m.157922 type:complete len:89 (-) Transcript_54913:22-288(-)